MPKIRGASRKYFLYISRHTNIDSYRSDERYLAKSTCLIVKSIAIQLATLAHISRIESLIIRLQLARECEKLKCIYRVLEIAAQLDDTMEAVRYTAFVVGQLIHLFCFSLQGQRLIDHSLQMRDKM